MLRRWRARGDKAIPAETSAILRTRANARRKGGNLSGAMEDLEEALRVMRQLPRKDFEASEESPRVFRGSHLSNA